MRNHKFILSGLNIINYSLLLYLVVQWASLMYNYSNFVHVCISALMYVLVLLPIVGLSVALSSRYTSHSSPSMDNASSSLMLSSDASSCKSYRACYHSWCILLHSWMEFYMKVCGNSELVMPVVEVNHVSISHLQYSPLKLHPVGLLVPLWLPSAHQTPPRSQAVQVQVSCSVWIWDGSYVHSF